MNFLFVIMYMQEQYAVNIRSDICVMKGDVRTHSASSSIFPYTSREKMISLIMVMKREMR